MRVVAMTQVWPNGLEPLRTPFNVQQFRALATRCDLSVLAAVPHVPGARFVGQPPRAALLSGLPLRETIAGIDTEYVRHLYVPKVGVPIAVPLYLASLAARPSHVARLRAADVVLATWAYPDGCAAILAAHAFGKPCVVKVHGSDVNVVAKIPSARAVLRRILPRAEAVVAVSRPLAEEVVRLGVDPARVHLVANGVDTSLFAPRDKRDARRALGIAEDGPLVLFVGRLEPQKGVGELLGAFAAVRARRPDARLALVGQIEGHRAWRDRVAAARTALGDAVIAPGPRPLAEVARWTAACDLFVLPSWAEGTPNVVLEALASGRPAIGTRVGGIPDVLADPRSGVVVPVRDEAALAAAIDDALGRSWDPASVRACGPKSWDESAAALYEILVAATRTRR